MVGSRLVTPAFCVYEGEKEIVNIRKLEKSDCFEVSQKYLILFKLFMCVTLTSFCLRTTGARMFVLTLISLYVVVMVVGEFLDESRFR